MTAAERLARELIATDAPAGCLYLFGPVDKVAVEFLPMNPGEALELLTSAKPGPWVAVGLVANAKVTDLRAGTSTAAHLVSVCDADGGWFTTTTGDDGGRELHEPPDGGVTAAAMSAAVGRASTGTVSTLN